MSDTGPPAPSASDTVTLMAREIAEQPEAIARTLDALLPLRGAIRELDADRREVLLVARGTSDNAAVYGRYLLEIHAARGAASAAPSLATHYRVRRDLSDTLVVAISQSGETSEIVDTQRWAASLGARTIAVTNVADSPLAREADLALVTSAGVEQAVPATKSHTTQLTAIAVVADALGPARSSLEASLREVPEVVQTLLRARSGVDEAVATLDASTTLLVSSRGLTFGTALEVALKLEETCLVPVRGLSYADLRHGPIAMVDASVAAVLVCAPDGPMVEGMTDLAGQLTGLGAATVGVGGPAGFASACDVAVDGGHLPEAAAPIALVVPGQLIVEALARRRGLDPDAPRSLSKVTRSDR
jgi:glutamine---fructose-6-phosphate transaminase (isomerizing)